MKITSDAGRGCLVLEGLAPESLRSWMMLFHEATILARDGGGEMDITVNVHSDPNAEIVHRIDPPTEEAP